MAVRAIEEPVTEMRLQEMAGRIVDAVHPDAVILFGSHARGDARPDSDVDIAVVFPDTLQSKREAHLATSMALRGFLFPIDILVYRRSEFEQGKVKAGHFVSQCLSNGRELYARPKSA